MLWQATPNAQQNMLCGQVLPASAMSFRIDEPSKAHRGSRWRSS